MLGGCERNISDDRDAAERNPPSICINAISFYIFLIEIDKPRH